MSAWPGIDWAPPWWQPLRAAGQAVEGLVQQGLPVAEALNTYALQASAASKLRFVSQSALPEGLAYESFIFETQTVPTRDNLHDFFNGLAWLLFPRIKAKLNALQYAEISRSGVGQQRGPLRDALTLFDENAAFLRADLHAPIIEALRQRDWRSVFYTHRALLAAHPPVLFGHALLEKLVSPYKSVTAHVFPARAAMNFIVTGESSALSSLDEAVAAQLSETTLVPKPFVPLPVLGVPRWWPENESPDFYTDITVFRPPRS